MFPMDTGQALGLPRTPDPIAGAKNLFEECLRLSAGQDVLLIIEPPECRHYDAAMVPFVAEQAWGRGARVTTLAIHPDADLAALAPAFIAALAKADHTIFLNRIGDRVRFGGLACPGTKTMMHAPNLDYLGNAFARTSFKLLDALRTSLMQRISAATICSLRCPQGSDLEMWLHPEGEAMPQMTEFAVQNFPVMIIPPMPAASLSGRLMLTGALVSTNTDVYSERVLPLRTPLALLIERGRIRDFEGEAELVRRVRAHFERVGALGAGDPWSVNSWHTGINPNTYFRGRADADWERWDAVVFGSPRYTHFHMCGADPGLVCGQLFDATISFDGEAYWRNGEFCLLERPEIQALLERYPAAPELRGARRDIGIDAPAISVQARAARATDNAPIPTTDSEKAVVGRLDDARLDEFREGDEVEHR